MKLQIVLLLGLLLLLGPTLLVAQENAKELKQVATVFEAWRQQDWGGPLQKLPWDSGRSSVLVERDKPRSTYERDKIEDNDPTTCWVGDKPKVNDIGDWIYIKVDSEIDSYQNFPKYSAKITITIQNGFCKSEHLFKANNRVKKAELRIYDRPLKGTFVDQASPLKVTWFADPKLETVQIIDLADTMEPQQFTLTISPESLNIDFPNHKMFYCLLKLTIIDVYPGTTYHDTCISELHAKAKRVPREETAQAPDSPVTVPGKDEN